MAGYGTFLSLLSLIGFFAAVWSGSKLCRLISMPALLLEIGAGILFGPQVVRLMDHQYAVCQMSRFSKACQLPPDFDERIRKGLPLGATLGRIAHMDYCPARVYVPGLLQRNRTAVRQQQDNASQYNSTAHHKGRGSSTTVTTTGKTKVAAKPTATTVTTTKHMHKGHNRSTDASNRTNVTVLDVDSLISDRTFAYVTASYKECLRQSCEADLRRTCEKSPDLFTMIGHAGVGLLVFQNAMRFDYYSLRSVGLWGMLVGLVGAVIPGVTGAALVALYGKPLTTDALLAGAAMVPSSTNIALQLLRRAGVTDEGFGKVVVNAALLDNVIALFLFDIFFNLGGSYDGFRNVVCPIVGVILVVAAMVAAVFFWPRFLQSLLMPLIPRLTWDPKINLADESLFLIMLGILVLYAWIMHLLGNFLWGCFIAGMSFACLMPQEQIREGWAKQAKVLTIWMVRIFYSCTVALSIPVDVLFHGEQFWKGTLLGFFPCILGKVVSACFLGETRFVIGWLMVGRAEIAYFIAAMSATAGMMDMQTYCIVLWALLWADLLGPALFRVTFDRYLRLPHATREVDFASVAVPHGTKVEDTAWEGPLDSLDGIDLEELAKYDSPQLKEASATEEASEETEKKSGNGGGLLCCLFFKQVVVH